MTVKRTLVIILILTLAGLALSLWAYPRLPEMVPSHWNAAGEVDGWMPRTTSVFLIPAIMLAMGLLLVFIPEIDPLRKNVERFRNTYNLFIVGFALYMLFIHIAVTLAGLGVQFNMTYAIIPAMAILFFGIGMMMDKAQPNWFIGVRTPWTLSSPTVWKKTHRLAARMFKISAVLMIISLLFPPEVSFILAMIPILITSIVTVVYSYIAFREEQNSNP